MEIVKKIFVITDRFRLRISLPVVYVSCRMLDLPIELEFSEQSANSIRFHIFAATITVLLMGLPQPCLQSTFVKLTGREFLVFVS